MEYAERHPRLTDAAVAVALLAGAVLGVHLVGPGEGRPSGLWVADVLAGLACLALLKAREQPRAVVVVTTACAVVMGALGYLLTPLLLAPVMVALYWLAASVAARTAWIYGGCSTALVVGAAVGIDDLDQTVVLRIIGPALWLLLPLSMGSRSRLRLAYLDAVHARAEHAERTREEEARLRVTEERMRIARDLHDVVAHHMAVANAQAGTAAHLLGSDPDLTRRLLADLQVTTSSVMLELRDTVGVLRQAGDADPLEPAPGLARLPDLLEVCGSAGLAVTLTVEGEPRDLPPGVDLTAYRIVQEALTNATKYAAPATATLRLRYTSSTLTIMVANATRTDAAARDTNGFGIIGMRERAHAVGGELRVHAAGAGFEVVTALPLHRGVAP
ncbi:sensor histidine kinase [Dactylosporangium siamense]|uniref:histidine kinase n=1 Tax=Dactylosporangium siamense TaxID=685454 RepID=A0A919PZS6_9ACTN|nr:sensor histidine kinase [Dactylosporangium siamense]GIG52652.1 two-component sensor histidine kinase [Dactylosporangium siamense]